MKIAPYKFIRKLLFVFILYPVNFLASATSIGIEDMAELFSAFEGKNKLYVVTVNLNEDQFVEEDQEKMNDLYNLSLKNYDDENLDFVDNKIKKDFLEYSKESLKNIKKEILSIVQEDKEDIGMKYDSFIKISTLLNNVQDKSKKFIQGNIKKSLLKQEEICSERIKLFFNHCNDFVKDINKKDFVIIVMQEALLNYFKNPEGMGNFLPFNEENYKKFMKNLSDFSDFYKNVFFIPNVIYKKLVPDLKLYEKNFEELAQIKHSYFDTKFIVDRFENLKMQKKPSYAIQNESFLSWQNNHFSHYQKQYILDGDIPLNYYPDDFYVPGMVAHVQNEEWQKIFTIEICQDHYRKARLEDYNPSSLFHIVQSATIPLERQTFKNKQYTGMIIHADVKAENNETLFYLLGKEIYINPLIEKKFDQFLFKAWNIEEPLHVIYQQKAKQKFTKILEEMK